MDAFLIYVQGYPKIRRMFIRREDITLIITPGQRKEVYIGKSPL